MIYCLNMNSPLKLVQLMKKNLPSLLFIFAHIHLRKPKQIIQEFLKAWFSSFLIWACWHSSSACNDVNNIKDRFSQNVLTHNARGLWRTSMRIYLWSKLQVCIRTSAKNSVIKNSTVQPRYKNAVSHEDDMNRSWSAPLVCKFIHSQKYE